MTTLYRTPNIIIDKHEWFARIVLTRHGTALTEFSFRPVSDRPQMWSRISTWKGRLPKGLHGFFRAYRLHMEQARQTAERYAQHRREAA